MKPGPDVSTIYRIARYYYADGFSQDQIAGKEGVSRSQISRLIDKARELGLVRITLVPPSSLRAEELARDLASFGPEVGDRRTCAQERERRRNLAGHSHRAADASRHWRITIRRSWLGYTVYKTAELLPRGLGRAPGHISSPYRTSGMTIPTCDQYDHRSFRGSLQDQGALREYSLREETDAPLSRIEAQRVAMLQERWGQLMWRWWGWAPTDRRPIDELPAECKAELKRSSACGYSRALRRRRRDSQCRAQLCFWLSISPPAKAQASICLRGAAKVGGIVTAARAGFISDLITDESTAIEALERARRRHGAQAPVRDAEVPESGAKAL